MVRDAVNKEIDNKYEQALRVYKLAIDEMTTIEDPKLEKEFWLMIWTRRLRNG